MRLDARSRPHGFVLAALICLTLSTTSAEASTAYTELRVEGMTCAACVSRVNDALSKVPGVIKADVSLEDERAYIQLDGDAIPSQAALIKAIEEAGFKASSSVGREYQEHEAFDASQPETPAAPATTSDKDIPVHTLSNDGAELRRLFNADADKVRLVLLLSPS